MSGGAAPPGAGVCEDCRRPLDGPEGCSAHERNADAYGWVDDCYRATIILLRAEVAGLREKLKQAERRGEEERAKALRAAAEEADAAKLRLGRSELPSDSKMCAVAAITAFAVKLRSMAAGQPSGDARGTK